MHTVRDTPVVVSLLCALSSSPSSVPRGEPTNSLTDLNLVDFVCGLEFTIDLSDLYINFRVCVTLHLLISVRFLLCLRLSLCVAANVHSFTVPKAKYGCASSHFPDWISTNCTVTTYQCAHSSNVKPCFYFFFHFSNFITAPFYAFIESPRGKPTGYLSVIARKAFFLTWRSHLLA